MADIDGGEVLFTIRGDASQLEAELGRARDGLEDLEGAADDTSGGLEGMGRQAGRVSTAFQGLARGGIRGVSTALSAVNPAAGKLVRVFGSLAAMSGPLAIAVGAVGAALLVYKSEADKAADAAEDAARRVEDLTTALEDQSDIADSLRIDLRLINGEIDELGLASEKRKARVESAGEAVVAAIDEQITAQEELIRVQREERGVNLDREKDIENLKEALAGLNQERADAIEATESQIAAVDAIENYNRELRESEEALKRREEQRKASARADEEASKTAAEAERARLAAMTERIDQVIAKNQELSQELSSGMDQFNADVEAGLDASEAMIVEGMEQTTQGISDMMTGTSSLSATLSDQMAEHNIRGAKAMFRVSQAAALGDIAMATSVAIMKALANPFGGRIAAAGIAMTGAAQTAIVIKQKPPAEHIGSGMPGNGDPLAPDERLSGARRILAQELSGPGGTVNSMGSSMVNDLNSGRLSGGGGQITAIIGRTHLDQELFQSGRRGTSRYARQLRTNPHPKPNRGW